MLGILFTIASCRNHRHSYNRKQRVFTIPKAATNSDMTGFRVSGYYLDSSEDNQDILGNKLYTYQDYLNYKSKYVSLRVDTDVIPIRSLVTTSEFLRYGSPVKFVACDVSNTVKGNHISICTDSTSSLSKFTKYDITIHVSSQSYNIYP